jgi:hypothetical protein
VTTSDVRRAVDKVFQAPARTTGRSKPPAIMPAAKRTKPSLNHRCMHACREPDRDQDAAQEVRNEVGEEEAKGHAPDAQAFQSLT